MLVLQVFNLFRVPGVGEAVKLVKWYDICDVSQMNGNRCHAVIAIIPQAPGPNID